MRKIITAICLVLLAGCSTAAGLTGANCVPTVAASVPVVLQDAQNLRQLEAGLAAISASPVTVMPPPIMTQPPPVVVSPSPTGPVVTPVPLGTVVAAPAPAGPIATPNARRRRASPQAGAWPSFDFSGSTFRFDGQGRAEPLASSKLAAE